MSSFPILDLVVGIVFLFFLLSIICSSIVEMVLTIKKVRADVLGQWLLHIFDTKIINAKKEEVSLGQEIMDHCAVTALSDPKKAPSYIDTKNFVSAVLDKIAAYSKVVSPKSIDDYIQSIESSAAISTELKRTFLIYAAEVKDTLNEITVKTTGAIEMFRSKIENWYDSNMDRLTGTLKQKYTRRFTLITGIIVTLLMNADTMEISKYLYNNPEMREKLAARAYETSADDSIKHDMEKIKTNSAINDSVKLTVNQLNDSLKAKLDVVNKAHAALKESIPLGWSSSEFTIDNEEGGWIGFLLRKLIGMAVTVIAIMMGAPFWFDVLNKISNLRGVGKRPAESKKNDNT
jgi:hypothetical protein